MFGYSQASSSEAFTCHQSEMHYLNSPKGRVETIELIILKDSQVKSLSLKLNKKPKPRVQTITLADNKDLPTEWRSLPGLSAEEVIDYFKKNSTIQTKSLIFSEFPGFGGRKISWKENSGTVSCSII